MKYCTRLRSGHGTVIINIGQPFKFAVYNSTPIAHCTKRSEARYDTMDIIEPILPNSFLCQQCFDSVRQNYIMNLP